MYEEVEDMWRTVEYHHFRDGGDLGGHGVVVIGNAGIAAKYNPIPGIIEWMLMHPCKENYFLAKQALYKYFSEIRLCPDKYAADVADDVLKWYMDPHCHACHGTGVKNIEQEMCDTCRGVPKRPKDRLSSKGLHEVESLFAWREKQLRRRNR